MPLSEDKAAAQRHMSITCTGAAAQLGHLGYSLGLVDT